MDLDQYAGNFGTNAANTGSGPSPFIWKDCPWSLLESGDVPGYHFYDNFAKFKASTNVNASEAFWTDGWMVFGSDGYAITLASNSTNAANAFGTATVGSDGDNEGGSIRQATANVKITGPNATASSRSGKMWLEARIKTSTIADTKHNIFLGLVEDVAATAAIPITATGTIADKNCVGFHRPESARSAAGSGGAIFNAVYKADGVTAVTVQTDAAAIVADTYQKLGLKYDPDTGYLYFFNNGVIVASKSIPAAAGTDFPNDIQMGFIFSVLNATGTTPGTSVIDWVRIAQKAA